MFLAFIRLFTVCSFRRKNVSNEEIQYRRMRMLPLYGSVYKETTIN